MGQASQLFGNLLSRSKQTCLSCKHNASLINEHIGLCSACYHKIPWITEVHCQVCGRYEACSDCRRRTSAYFVKSRSAVKYDEAMKELLARYKYRGDEQLKSLLGHMLVHAFQQIQIGLPSAQATTSKKGMPRIGAIITYVPVSEQRFLERGFNQAEQMAVELGRRVGVSVIPLLRRARHTDKQSFKSRGARIDDLQDVFVVDEIGMKRLIQQGQTLSLKNLHIYIVDDVYTTGSTMNECAKILNLHMEATYMGLTWAR